MDMAVQDQANRWGLDLDEYLYGSSNSYEGGFEMPDSFQKGNPFFTQTNQPQMGRTNSTFIKRPFKWSGNNKSLRKVYNQSYNDYWNNEAENKSTGQQQTWQGPQIRATYQGQANGLAQLGTPSYWQDNNQNQMFETEMDDSFSFDPNQPAAPAQVDSMPTESQDTMNGGPFGFNLEDFYKNGYSNMGA